MEEEFQESEVIFSDDDQNMRIDSNNYFNYQEMVVASQSNSRGLHNNKSKKKKRKKTKNSVPINIPENIFHPVDSDDFEDEYYDDDEMVPPHVIVGRRIVGKMAFSVCTGNGRTLKGRDLSQVRNTILRMTGFLET